MGTPGLSFCVILCFLRTVFCNVHHLSVGPCVVSTPEVSFNCSNRKLADIPGQVWDNVSMLDISQNNMNLTCPNILKDLHRFHQLVMLNLSGNYLPLLEKDCLGTHSLLQVLDISKCQMKGIKAGAFQGLPKLERLFLRSNQLQEPLPSEMATLSFLDLNGNDNLKSNRQDWIQKLGNVSLTTDTAPGNQSEDTNVNRAQSSKSWEYPVAVLATAIFTSIFIALVAKGRLIHRYLASYRHTLLPEVDVVSQGVPAGQEMNVSAYDAAERGQRVAGEEELDDDGFIEDNYIQDCERERAERAVDELEEESVSCDVPFSIA